MTILLNDKKSNLSPFIGNFTSIDLSLASIDLNYDLPWSTNTDNFGSDHFPIIINYKRANSSCGEEHEANDKDCKRYQEEVEILKIKVQQQISGHEAVEKFQREKKTSYSAKTYNDQTENIENLEKKVCETRVEI
ncbi:hypothetical protein TNCV_2962471 [Trichonephila clavipes]|nr:hypothetical protein TNCV_2962471 [Trichonephila clavipes]